MDSKIATKAQTRAPGLYDEQLQRLQQEKKLQAETRRERKLLFPSPEAK